MDAVNERLTKQQRQEMLADLNKPKRSAVYEQAIENGATPEEAAEIEGRNVFGHDAKKDGKGNWIEQGIGAPGHETPNHFAALKKAEREATSRSAVTIVRSLRFGSVILREPKRLACRSQRPPDEPSQTRHRAIAVEAFGRSNSVAGRAR